MVRLFCLFVNLVALSKLVFATWYFVMHCTGTPPVHHRQYIDTCAQPSDKLLPHTSQVSSKSIVIVTPSILHENKVTHELMIAIGEKRDIWKMIEGIKENGEQPNTTLQQLFGQEKKAARRAVDEAKREMEEELYKTLDEDCGKTLILKMAQERDEDSKDVKTGSVIKYKNGKLVTDRKYVLKAWKEYIKELLNQRENSE